MVLRGIMGTIPENVPMAVSLARFRGSSRNLVNFRKLYFEVRFGVIGFHLREDLLYTSSL